MSADNQDRFEAAYQSAAKLMEQEWLQAGMSQEELEQSKRIADSLDTLAACGIALDSITPSQNLTHINYATLNARQQENYNFQKVSAILADYGFTTLRLTDDWHGADFIAQHIDGETFLKIQLKGRLTFSKKYVGKGLHIAFRTDCEWYLYPHDELLAVILAETNVAETRSWRESGEYSFPGLSRQLRQLLAAYRIAGSVQLGPDIVMA